MSIKARIDDSRILYATRRREVHYLVCWLQLLQPRDVDIPKTA